MCRLLEVFEQMGTRHGKYAGILFSAFKMAPFRTFLTKIICHLLCFAGNCDISDDRSYTPSELEAVVRDFAGKEKSQAEPDREPSNSRSRIKRNRARVSKKTRGPNVTDAGRQNRKSLPTTPWGTTVTATTSESQQRVRNHPPAPTRRPPSSPPRLSQSVMSIPTLKKTLDMLHHILSHTRYMVTGTAAMAIWGYVPPHVNYLPRHVSISCTDDDVPVIKSWAAASPHCVLIPSCPGMIGVGIEGKIRAVKIRTVAREMFERLGRVSPLGLNRVEQFRGWREGILRTGVWVVSLRGLLEDLCAGWGGCFRKGNKTLEEEERLRRCGLGILWILRRMREDGGLGKEWDLRGGIVAREEFWVPFTGVWWEGVGLMLALGLLREVASDERELRQTKVWTGNRWLYVTSVVPEEEGKDKGKEHHVSLTTITSSGDSEDSDQVELPAVKLDTDLARYHPDSFRVRAGLRDGSVGMREYAALVATQVGHEHGPQRNDSTPTCERSLPR
ncbi:Putative protein of unknown function [Podospora comata]|uniref:Uncharacterized protein n=1 Tax=Podospora comata TaxID=48703 RepID=A0ABY6RUJ2_PODCO|nr:Putative protein of unknown function [Podospora comata]